MAKDYYNLLGVGKDASADQIKKAFRSLAHKHHPDKEGGDAEKFKEINEAYQVLSDAEKRKRYDQFGEAGVNGNGAAGGGWDDMFRQGGFQGGFANGQGFNVDLGDIFSDFFGGAARGRGGRSRKPHGADIQMDLEIDFKDAAFGIKKTVELYKSVVCTRCHGNAAEPGTPITECATCKGSGVIESVQRSLFGAIRTQAECTTCTGDGKIPEKKCTECRGTGTMKKSTEIEVTIPAGIDNEQTIRVTGQGEAGQHGGRVGDLYIVLHVTPRTGWKRVGDDVESEERVPYTTMALGGKVSVETLDGEAMVKIPAGTASGTAMRLRGKGVSHLQSAGRGDHIVTVHVAVPKHVGFRQKRLLKDLAESGDQE